VDGDPGAGPGPGRPVPVLHRRYLSSTTSEFLERTGAPNIKKPFVLRDIRQALARVPARVR
jgi:hypothetical protein